MNAAARRQFLRARISPVVAPIVAERGARFVKSGGKRVAAAPRALMRAILAALGVALSLCAGPRWPIPWRFYGWATPPSASRAPQAR